MLIGSASAVTYMSEMAKLTIKNDSTFLTLLFEAMASNVNIFLTDPTNDATERMTIVGQAAHGLEFRISCFPKTPAKPGCKLVNVLFILSSH